MHCSWHLSPRASLLTNIDTTEQAFCLSNASMRQQVKNVGLSFRRILLGQKLIIENSHFLSDKVRIF